MMQRDDEVAIPAPEQAALAKTKKLGTIGTFVKEQIVPPVIEEMSQKWDELEPKLLGKWDEFEPQLLDLLEKKLDEWLPRIIQTILLSVGTAGGKAISDAEDAVTDFIPGTLDDKLDPFVKDAFDKLGPMIAGMFGGRG